MEAGDSKHRNKYLITLEKRHSIIALTAGILVLSCALFGIILWLELYDQTGEKPMHYFTFLSNLFTAIGAAFMIPYATEGITKKHLVIPRYVTMFQFAGAICISITFFVTIAFLLPINGTSAVTGMYFWLHIFVPVCTVILFLSVETGIPLNRRDMLISLIPFGIYMLVYFFMVYIVGEENGGWSDIYMTGSLWPAWVSFLLIVAIALAVSTVLRVLQNRSAVKTWRNITHLWREDLAPAEVLVEAFGLGRYTGAKVPGAELPIPLDILFMLSERYKISLDKLVKAYVKGALDARKELFDNETDKALGEIMQSLESDIFSDPVRSNSDNS